MFGLHYRIRTCDLLLRRQLLYPAELSEDPWYSHPDSNRDAIWPQILSLLCLPIPSCEHLVGDPGLEPGTTPL
jgi:hypothetical protein